MNDFLTFFVENKEFFLFYAIFEFSTLKNDFKSMDLQMFQTCAIVRVSKEFLYFAKFVVNEWDLFSHLPSDCVLRMLSSRVSVYGIWI